MHIFVPTNLPAMLSNLERSGVTLASWGCQFAGSQLQQSMLCPTYCTRSIVRLKDARFLADAGLGIRG